MDYLLDQDTMNKQVGKTLDERAHEFMRLFPSKSMSRSRLQRIYKKHGVKYKKVVLTKILTPR